jgi:glycosyltransferase involved in cell wall biosynthesis
MTILWIYHSEFDPNVGGTERATHLVMSALEKKGYTTAGLLAFRQDHPRAIYDHKGQQIDNLYALLKDSNVQVVVNQIGYSKWLLEEFLARGGQRWKDEGGVIITCQHFDPSMFPETLWGLFRHWNRKTPLQKMRRLGRIALLPINRRKAARGLRQAYADLIEMSDHYVILSERHRWKLCAMSGTPYPERVRVIPNPNTFATPLSKDRIRDKCKVALIVSRLDEPQKKISRALRAWASVMRARDLSDWNLQIVGDGEYREDYREFVSKMRIPNVHFIGRTDPEAYYESASLYLHTARREGWGLTITEAMQKGAVPIVMNSCAVYEDFIDDGQSGFLTENGNVKAFAAHVIELMRDAEKRQRMAERAIEKTRQNDLESIIEKWSEIVSLH